MARMRADVNQLLGDDEVTGRTDGEELRDAFDDAEQRGLGRGQLVLRGLGRRARDERQEMTEMRHASLCHSRPAASGQDSVHMLRSYD